MPGRYQPSRQPRWISIGLIAAIHAAGFIALQHMEVGNVRLASAPPLVVNLLPLDPPPPEPVTLPTEKVIERTPERQQIVAPPPIVAIPTAPAAAQSITKLEPTPQPPPVQAEETKSAPPRDTETMVNLSTRLLSAEPPRYPTEARRRRETGTVVLMVVVNEEGRVAAISIADSSGVDRLDKAALSAVRQWRWSPTIIDGRPSEVRGLVRIPFELKGAPSAS